MTTMTTREGRKLDSKALPNVLPRSHAATTIPTKEQPNDIDINWVWRSAK